MPMPEVAHHAERPDLRTAHAHRLLDLLEVRLDRVEDLAELAKHGDRGLVMVDRRIGHDGDEFGASGHGSIIGVDSTVDRHSFRVCRGPGPTKKRTPSKASEAELNPALPKTTGAPRTGRHTLVTPGSSWRLDDDAS